MNNNIESLILSMNLRSVEQQLLMNMIVKEAYKRGALEALDTWLKTARASIPSIEDTIRQIERS